MKLLASALLLVALIGANADAQIRRPASQAQDDEGIFSRTVIHPDETRTVSKQDINNKIREKQTLDKNGILLMRSIFQLSASGKPINGLVYDGRNRLLYRSEFTYDNASRLQEERVFAADGTPVRRLVYKPDRFGKMKPFALSFADGKGGVSRSAGSGRTTEELATYSTNSPHAYRGGGVANTPSAYRPSATAAPSNSRSKKRERRFKIFRRR